MYACMFAYLYVYVLIDMSDYPSISILYVYIYTYQNISIKRNMEKVFNPQKYIKKRLNSLVIMTMYQKLYLNKMTDKKLICVDTRTSCYGDEDVHKFNEDFQL